MELPRPAPAASPVEAWQPLTFGGVAAFVSAPAGRLLLVAALVAVVLSGVVLRFAVTVWSPTISTAVTQLPAVGSIEDGRLLWPAAQAVALADNAFVSVLVTPPGVPPAASSADLQFEFRTDRLTVTSLLGLVDLEYPRGYVFALNRTELEPLWGAWRPHLLGAVAGATFVGLLVMWAVLATLLALPVRAYLSLLGRRASLGGAWKLALAALLPGALLMGGAILGYSLRRLSLGELLLVNGLHLLVNAAYLLISPLRLPAGYSSPFGEPVATPEPSANPFAAAAEDDAAASLGESTSGMASGAGADSCADELADSQRPPLGRTPPRSEAGPDEPPLNPS